MCEYSALLGLSHLIALLAGSDRDPSLLSFAQLLDLTFQRLISHSSHLRSLQYRQSSLLPFRSVQTEFHRHASHQAHPARYHHHHHASRPRCLRHLSNRLRHRCCSLLCCCWGRHGRDVWSGGYSGGTHMQRSLRHLPGCVLGCFGRAYALNAVRKDGKVEYFEVEEKPRLTGS